MISFSKPLSWKGWTAVTITTIYLIYSAVILDLANQDLSYLMVKAPTTYSTLFAPTTAKNGTIIWDFVGEIQYTPEDLRLASTKSLFASGVMSIIGCIAIIFILFFRPKIPNDRVNISRRLGCSIGSILTSITFFLFAFILITTIAMWTDFSNSSKFNPTSKMPNDIYLASAGHFSPEAWNCQLSQYLRGDPQTPVDRPANFPLQYCGHEHTLRFMTLPFVVLAALTCMATLLVRRKPEMAKGKQDNLSDY